MNYFVSGKTARTLADLMGIHRNMAIRFFHKLREKIAMKQHNRSEQSCGKIELDESYFGGSGKGKCGRGATGKVAVFDLLKSGGKAYTQIILHVKSNTLMPIIREFSEKHNHINGIEIFWNQAKRHIRTFNGIPRQHFNRFLKECEWRFNRGTTKELKKLVKEFY